MAQYGSLLEFTGWVDTTNMRGGGKRKTHTVHAVDWPDRDGLTLCGKLTAGMPAFPPVEGSDEWRPPSAGGTNSPCRLCEAKIDQRSA